MTGFVRQQFAVQFLWSQALRASTAQAVGSGHGAAPRASRDRPSTKFSQLLFMQLCSLIPNPGQHSCTVSVLAWAQPWKPEGETDRRKESGALEALVDLIKEELTLRIFILIFLNYITSNSTSCASLPSVIPLITTVCFSSFVPHPCLDGNGRHLGTHTIF